MIIGLQIDHIMQMIIREKMLEKIPDMWDFPLINPWESVLDEGISKGKTNWQLFGSRKPGNEAYELTHHYIMKIDEGDGQYSMDEEDVAKFDMKNNFAKLSVQYDKHPKFEINPVMIDEYNKRLENKGNKSVYIKSSVTRWLYKLGSLWPFRTMKNSPNSIKYLPKWIQNLTQQ